MVKFRRGQIELLLPVLALIVMLNARRDSLQAALTEPSVPNLK